MRSIYREIPKLFSKVDSDNEYNEWSKQLAARQREPGQKIVYVKVKGLKPAKLRLLKPKVVVA